MATGVFLYYPSTLNLDELSESKGFKEIERFSKDELCYMLQIPRYLPTVSEKILTPSGYTKISSAIAQRFVRKYNHYLAELCMTGILECDHQFIRGLKSVGYKFLEPHKTAPLSKYEVVDSAFAEKLKKFKLVPAELVSDYGHLTNWFNGKLRANESAAKAFLEEYENSVKLDATRKMINAPVVAETRAEIKELDKAFNTVFNLAYDHFYGISRINQDWYTLSVDETAGRFHSNLTNLKSELRNALNYDGKLLVSIDLKNSQPFMSLALLNPEFYHSSYRVEVTAEQINLILSGKANTQAQPTKLTLKQPDIPSYSLTLQSINPDIASRILGKESPTTSSTALITLVELNSLTNSLDAVLYRRLVQDGTLYDYLEKCMIADGMTKPKDRRALKGIVFQALFTANSFYSQPEAAPKRLFANAFPTIYKLFSLLKTRDKTDLPVLLQTIESYLFIHVITKRIAREHPEIPIFTIHDSIVTTVGNEEYVQTIMTEELERAIGAAPSYGIEYYSIDELNSITSFLKTRNRRMNRLLGQKVDNPEQ